jgi:hypothetical protein
LCLRGSRLQGIRPSHSQMRQGSRSSRSDDAAVVENLLKLGSGTNRYAPLTVADAIGRLGASSAPTPHRCPFISWLLNLSLAEKPYV